MEDGYRWPAGQHAPDSTLSSDFRQLWKDNGTEMPPYSEVRGRLVGNGLTPAEWPKLATNT